MRAEEIKKEIAKRVRKNGGRSLRYVLMPKSFKKESVSKKRDGDEERYYRVPKLFDRLSKGEAKIRDLTPKSDCGDTYSKSTKSTTRAKNSTFNQTTRSFSGKAQCRQITTFSDK